MSNNPGQDKDKVKIFTLEEVKEHTTRESVWFVIHNKVYDVTTFLEEHPGGEEVLLEQAGKNASEIFEDVSHSADAKDLMKDYLLGELDEKDKIVEVEETGGKNVPTKPIKHFNDSEHSLSLSWTQWTIAILLSIGTSLLVRNMLDNSS